MVQRRSGLIMAAIAGLGLMAVGCEDKKTTPPPVKPKAPAPAPAPAPTTPPATTPPTNPAPAPSPG